MSLPPDALAYQEAHITDDRAPILNGVTAMFLILVIAAQTGRFLARRVSSQPLKSDDWTSLFATFTFVSIAIEVFLSTRWGAGKHVITLTDPNNARMFGQVTFAFEISYIFCVTAFKASVLLLYRRIFEMRVTYFRYAFWAFAAYLAGYFISLLVVVLTACNPISSYWAVDQTVCRVNYLPGMIYNILNAVADTVLLSIPIPIIWGLNMPKRQRLATIGIFLLGSFVIIVSCLRVPSLKAASEGPDPSFDEVDGVIWTVAECAVGIICANLPSMKPLFSKFLGAARSSGNRSRDTYSANKLAYGLGKSDQAWETIESDRTPINKNMVTAVSSNSDEDFHNIKHDGGGYGKNQLTPLEMGNIKITHSFNVDRDDRRRQQH